MIPFDDKDPDDIDDFTLDWADLLGAGEAITTFVPNVEVSTATIADSGITGTRTTARIAGGAAGERADVRYRVTTSTGRQLDLTIRFSIKPQ